jgi:hypothetical protein
MTRLLLFSLRAALILPAGLAIAGQPNGDTTIVSHGKSTYCVVIPQQANPVERKAADELVRYVRLMSDVTLPVVDDTAPERKGEFLLGRTNRTARLLPGFDAATLEADGFTIRSVGGKIVILGGTKKGTLYGVYTLLEEYLGCRMYSATAIDVPKRTTVALPLLNTTQVPFIRHREIHYLNAMDRAYSEWHKVHSSGDRDEAWGMFVHTFDRLVPAHNFFAPRPEFFSWQGSRRIPNGQLCLTNPDLFPVLTDSLRVVMARKPSAQYWSVSQNDNYNECQCERCRAENSRYGASSGTLLAFVNRVARMFPDKTISTLAYQYTRSAPKGITPEPNVNIMLCSIECNRSKPLAADPTSAPFVRDIEDWGALTDNIIMWDYVVQFRNLVSPFPNLRVLQPNIRLFVKNNIRMMFQQGCGANVGEFGELRTYLIAKLLWNPGCNIDSVMNDFLDGYYGAAGRDIRTYIDTMHDALERSGSGLGIYGYPYNAFDSYLTPPLIEEYSRIFDRAESKVSGNPTILERVKNARLPLEFAILDISLHDATPALSYFDKKDGAWTVKPSMRKRLDDFVAQAKKAGIQRLEEMGTSPDDYKRSVEQQCQVSVEGNLAFGKPVQLLTPYSDKYPVGGPRALTNGLHGPNDYNCNWLGFESQNLEAVIDLGKEASFSSVSAGFLQMWYAWIWLPLRVDVAVSSDGKTFKTVSSMANIVPDTTAGTFSKVFTADVGKQQARFVKVSAPARLTCPDWHIGAGQKSWIFVDEIVVR